MLYPVIRAVNWFKPGGLVGGDALKLDLDTTAGGTGSAATFSGTAVSVAPNARVIGRGIAQIGVTLSGLLDDGDEKLQTVGGSGATYTIDLSADGTTTVYGAIDEPDFDIEVDGDTLTITQGAY